MCVPTHQDIHLFWTKKCKWLHLEYISYVHRVFKMIRSLLEKRRTEIVHVLEPHILNPKLQTLNPGRCVYICIYDICIYDICLRLTDEYMIYVLASQKSGSCFQKWYSHLGSLRIGVIAAYESVLLHSDFESAKITRRCCRVLQCGGACCSVLQCVAVCLRWNLLQFVAVCCVESQSAEGRCMKGTEQSTTNLCLSSRRSCHMSAVNRDSIVCRNAICRDSSNTNGHLNITNHLHIAGLMSRTLPLRNHELYHLLKFTHFALSTPRTLSCKGTPLLAKKINWMNFTACCSFVLHCAYFFQKSLIFAGFFCKRDLTF